MCHSWLGEEARILNSAFINTTQDFEESSHAPAGTPRVSDSPVLLVGLGIKSISAECDGVASLDGTVNMLVNTALIVHEVLVDCESSLEGSSGDGSLDGLLVGADVSKGCALDEGGESRAVIALGWALTSDASLARLVGNALVSWQTSLLQEDLSHLEVTTIAALVALVARDDVLLRIDDTGSILLLYATVIGKGADS